MNSESQIRAGPSRSRPPRILVVEADHPTSESYRVGLSIAGFDVDCSRDGEEALARLITDGLPDVIVLDLGLPRVDTTRRRRDGFDLLDALRASTLTDRLPILAMSNDEGSLFEALHRGASDCIPSQIATSSLVRVVKDIVDDRIPKGWIPVDE